MRAASRAQGPPVVREFQRLAGNLTRERHERLHQQAHNKENLRICTPTQNHRNRSARIEWKGKTSAHKGVGFDKGSTVAGRNWRARIKINRKSKHIGWFATEAEAVRAYNEAAQQYFGEFACLNEIADAR